MQGDSCGTRLTLKKCDKLVYKAQFDQVRREGRKSVAPGLVAVVAPCTVCGCGVICSKKFSLLSVERNRARRLLWESFRLLKPHMTVCRIVLIPRQRIKNYRRPQVTAELAALLAEQKIIPRAVADSLQLQ